MILASNILNPRLKGLFYQLTLFFSVRVEGPILTQN